MFGRFIHRIFRKTKTPPTPATPATPRNCHCLSKTIFSGNDPDKNKAMIVLLSTAANIISCHTSMVGVDKNRKQKVVGDMMRRSVPMIPDQTLRSGAPRFYSSSNYADAARKRSSRVSRSVGGAAFSSYGVAASSQNDAMCYEELRCDADSIFAERNYECLTKSEASFSSVKRQKEPTKEPNYMNLVALQTFSGQWMLNAELASAMNATLVALQSAAPIKDLDVWATVLAITYLEVKFGDNRDEWEMVETKARQWLSLQDREGLSVDDLLQKAKAVVGQK